MNLPKADVAQARPLPARVTDFALPWLVGILLAYLFWAPLFHGAGFIGGDVYNYFFPLKQFYAEGLQHGEIRLWHPGIGNGVPVLGESQTGVFYPFYLVAYRFLDLNGAYNAVFLTHYVLAFVFTYWLARELGIGRLAALWGATIFVYGWFPPRACLEWAIVTGGWMPLAALCALRWMKRGAALWGGALAVVMLIQLLAGHFQLAFVTVLSVFLLTVLWQSPERSETPKTRGGRSRTSASPHGPGEGVTSLQSDRDGEDGAPNVERINPSPPTPLPGVPGRGENRRTLALRKAAVPVWLLAGFALAAPQLLPTWELRSRSQRAEGGFEAEVGFGNVPLAYFSQLIAPFYIYPHAEEQIRALGGQSNKIEAHLYFGIAPLVLVVGFLLSGRLRRFWRPWLALVVVGMLLASGWPFAWLDRVPGFSFFRYPGRYGLMAQLGMAMLAAAAGARLFSKSPLLGATARTLLLGATILDLLWVSGQVQYVSMVRPPVIQRIGQSPVFERLTATDRIFAMDGNTLAMSGAACVPPYLGMGPAEYYRIWGAMPDLFHGNAIASPEVIATLQKTGVSNLLTEKPLGADWPVTVLWSGYDPFLHPRWGRDPNEPLYLYRFDKSLGRAYAHRPTSNELDDASSATPVTIVDFSPHRVVVDTESSTPIELVLTDLQFPGWHATVDGAPHESAVQNEKALFRVVSLPAGKHQVIWSYRSGSFLWGCGIAATAFLGLGVTVYCLNRRRRCAR